MYQLPDVTFCILFKADSNERLENFKITFSFLYRNFAAYFSIVEVGKSPILKLNLKRCTYNFYLDVDPELNLTKYKNLQTLQCKTKYIGLWDCDVIIAPDQVFECIYQLRTGDYQISSPYNGRLIELNPFFKQIYKSNHDLNFIQNTLRYQEPMYGTISVGAAIFFDLDFYIEMGMDNRNFRHWGHEDSERIKRAEIFGGKMFRFNGPAYHLYHPRLKLSKEKSSFNRKQSLSEYLKVCALSQESIKSFIKELRQIKE